MGEIFTHPASLIVQIGKDLLVNHRSIKKDIESFKTDFAASSWEKSGRDIGDALALVLFGKGSSDVTGDQTKSTTEYNAYLVLAGYAYLH